jgi:hypothetical protein
LLEPGGGPGLRKDGPSMRMVIQRCWKRSSSASTRDFFWNSSYQSAAKSRVRAVASSATGRGEYTEAGGPYRLLHIMMSALAPPSAIFRIHQPDPIVDASILYAADQPDPAEPPNWVESCSVRGCGPHAYCYPLPWRSNRQLADWGHDSALGLAGVKT